MLRMFHFLSTTGHYFVSCHRSVGPAHSSPTYFRPSDMLFFLFCLQSQKYCSFKYCALHRIFCHKLVNIYIFSQYSDIYFHIYRTIKCFFFISFLFLFRFSFLREIPENVLQTAAKSSHERALRQCVRYFFFRCFYFLSCRQKTKQKQNMSSKTNIAKRRQRNQSAPETCCKVNLC